MSKKSGIDGAIYSVCLSVRFVFSLYIAFFCIFLFPLSFFCVVGTEGEASFDIHSFNAPTQSSKEKIQNKKNEETTTMRPLLFERRLFKRCSFEQRFL